MHYCYQEKKTGALVFSEDRIWCYCFQEKYDGAVLYSRNRSGDVLRLLVNIDESRQLVLVKFWLSAEIYRFYLGKI